MDRERSDAIVALVDLERLPTKDSYTVICRSPDTRCHSIEYLYINDRSLDYGIIKRVQSRTLSITFDSEI